MNNHLNKPLLLQAAGRNINEASKLEGIKKKMPREINRSGAEILDILEEENLNVEKWMFYLRKNGLKLFSLIK